MQIAMILSDLKSLSVCGHEDAHNLVNVHKSIPKSTKADATSTEPSDEKSKTDPDLQRAKELVELHYSVKLNYLREGMDAELQGARANVERVSRELSGQQET